MDSDQLDLHHWMELIKQISTSLDSKKYTLGIFIDLKRAFDTVGHDIYTSKDRDVWFKESVSRLAEDVHQQQSSVCSCRSPQVKLFKLYL